MKTFLSALVTLTILAGLPFAAGAAGGRSIAERLDDAWVTTKVKAKLSTEQVRNLVKVDVDTRNGVVHLQGTVPTPEDKAEAERLAWDTEGVVRVRNDLDVVDPTLGSRPSASPLTR